MSAEIKVGDRVSWMKRDYRERNRVYGVVKKIWVGRSSLDGGENYAIAFIRTDAGGHVERMIESLTKEANT